MGCSSQILTQEKRSVNADKTSQYQSPEANPSVENIQAVGSKDEMQPKMPRIKFPPACNSEAWSILDYTISKTQNKNAGKEEV